MAAKVEQLGLEFPEQAGRLGTLPLVMPASAVSSLGRGWQRVLRKHEGNFHLFGQEFLKLIR